MRIYDECVKNTKPRENCYLLFFFAPDDEDDDLCDESDGECVTPSMESSQSVKLSAVMSTCISSTSTWDEFASKRCWMELTVLKPKRFYKLLNPIVHNLNVCKISV